MMKQLLNYYYYSGGASFDADYQAVLDRATALGYTLPSEAQQEKQNTLVTSLKSSGIWSQLDILYIFATDGNNDFATLNWKAPSSYRITRSGTVTFTANQGYVSNGTNGYLNTTFIPSSNGVNLTLNSTSLTTYIQNNVSENKYDFGTAPSFASSSPAIWFKSENTFSTSQYSINQLPSATVGNGGSSVGFWTLQRKDASNVYLFRNGSQLDTEADASTSVPGGNLFLLCLNDGGVAGVGTYTTRRMSMFAAGASLSGLESAFYTHWNTYFTSL